MLNQITSDRVARIFPATPVRYIESNLPFLIDALAAHQCDRTMSIMALATIRAETESFLPIAEAPSRFNTAPGGPPFGLYDHRQDLGNQGPPDGERFRGRGYVQLTGRANYARIGQLLKVDLIDNPDVATDPQNAAAILVRFLLQNESRIRLALGTNDLAAARRCVNGGSHGLARFMDAFYKAEATLPFD
jgi:putative chitinase